MKPFTRAVRNLLDEKIVNSLVRDSLYGHATPADRYAAHPPADIGIRAKYAYEHRASPNDQFGVLHHRRLRGSLGRSPSGSRFEDPDDRCNRAGPGSTAVTAVAEDDPRGSE